jgi:nitroreductase
METQNAIKLRCSIREYLDKPIPEDKLLRVLEAARLAPSGSNKQAWKFIVVKDLKRRAELRKAAMGQLFVAQAPVVIAAVSTSPDQMMLCGIPAYAIDLAIAIDHMTLAAWDEGLGTCWIGAFSQDKAREVLGVPPSCKVVTLLPIGFPKHAGNPKSRKPMDEILCYETFK